MKLEVRDGRVVWVKADGTVSERTVSDKAAVEFCGFPVPSGPGGGRCQSLELIRGEPVEDEIILVNNRAQHQALCTLEVFRMSLAHRYEGGLPQRNHGGW